MAIAWVKDKILGRSSRPGYPSEKVKESEVNAWLGELKKQGIKSIICLLTEQDQRRFYGDLGCLLVKHYEDAGFKVANIQAQDHARPALSPAQLEKGWDFFSSLPKPVLVHCSAGLDRTGLLIGYLTSHRGFAILA